MKKTLKITSAILSFIIGALLSGGLMYGIFAFLANDLNCMHWGGWGGFAYLLFGVFPAVAIGVQVAVLVLDEMED